MKSSCFLVLSHQQSRPESYDSNLAHFSSSGFASSMRMQSVLCTSTAWRSLQLASRRLSAGRSQSGALSRWTPWNWRSCPLGSLESALRKLWRWPRNSIRRATLVILGQKRTFSPKTCPLGPSLRNNFRMVVGEVSDAIWLLRQASCFSSFAVFFILKICETFFCPSGLEP